MDTHTQTDRHTTTAYTAPAQRRAVKTNLLQDSILGRQQAI